MSWLRSSNIRQIKNNATLNIFKQLKEKVSAIDQNGEMEFCTNLIWLEKNYTIPQLCSRWKTFENMKSDKFAMEKQS